MANSIPKDQDHPLGPSAVHSAHSSVATAAHVLEADPHILSALATQIDSLSADPVATHSCFESSSCHFRAFLQIATSFEPCRRNFYIAHVLNNSLQQTWST